MFTKCAHCETLFRIHSEQLKAAQGLVRCAHCGEVFNALDHLHEDAQETAHADSVIEQQPGQTDNQSADADAVTTPPAETPQPDPPVLSPTPTEPPLNRFEPGAPLINPGISGFKIFLTNLFWSIGILILALLAVAQTAWFNREILLKYDEGRELVESYCEIAGCIIPPRRALEKLKIVDRVVASHPEVDNILRIHLTFENQAPFHQPFPILQVSLFTRDGELEAQRRFSPDEYTGVPTSPDEIMQPGQPVEIELDVVDPGPHVTGFEFAFF